MSTASENAATPDISYEAAREELITIVQQLETGGGSLEESLTLWERGEALAAICQQWLDGARERLAAASGNQSSVENGTNDAT
ncbi:MAG: exodeoxyribonuclease VII small subunit [Actinomycetales bacterium]|nr:exodeoxyribonuclease VII small subunit [Actinomycetales bacterium]